MLNLNYSLDNLTYHYLIAALWSSCSEKDIPLDKDYTVDDFAPLSVLEALNDCRVILSTVETLSKYMDIEEEYKEKVESYIKDTEQIGHDFWLTRNGHGAGFWDRGLGNLGEALTTISNAFREKYVFVDTDGLLYFD
jgi:hypothetical protein